MGEKIKQIFLTMISNFKKKKKVRASLEKLKFSTNQNFYRKK